MTPSSAFLLIFVCALAASYGWGMRGAVIGGEKGALLPGALIGLSVSLFSGIELLQSNWQLVTAAAALSMGYGGFEPYAQTADYLLHDKAAYAKPSKCFAGLFLKGANWFGIFCGITSIGILSLSGRIYTAAELILLFALIPFLQLLGIRLFNKPFDREKGIFPKIYFSRSSREEWGGNLLTLLAIAVLAAIKKDTVTLSFLLTGILAGGIGWGFSMWLCYISAKAQNRYVDSWKIMEFSYGTIGGAAFSACFVLNGKKITALLSGAEKAWQPFEKGEAAFAWAAFALIILMAIQYITEKKLGEKGNRALELCERTFYYQLMLCLVLLGNTRAARLTVFCVILWVLFEENVFDDRLKGLPRLKAAKVIMAVLFVLSVAGEILLPSGYPVMALLGMYTVFYIVSDVLYYLIHFKKPGAFTTVHAYFILQSAALFLLFGRAV